MVGAKHGKDWLWIITQEILLPDVSDDSEEKQYLGVSIPNLDGMDEEDLQSLSKVLDTLFRYCVNKTEAAAYRRGGAIRDAKKLEKECERLYGRLPKELRW